MKDKILLFFKNWKTSVPALLAVLCAADSEWLHVLPDDWASHARATCVFLLALGLIGAKDADKTHSKIVVEPQPDPVTVPVENTNNSKEGA